MKYLPSRRKRWLLIGFGLVVGGVLILAAWGGFKWRTLEQSLSSSDEVVNITVENGSNWQAVSQRLEKRGVIPDAQIVRWYVQWRDISLKPGVYAVNSKLTVKELIGRLADGPNREEVRVSIPEGSRILDIAEITSEKLQFTKKEFMDTAKGYDTTGYDFIEGPSLQGYLFPDTYRFFPDASPEKVVDTMLATFEQKALPLLKRTNSDMLSSYEVLILASIVEKEVFREEDRRKAADVFLNRLEQDRKLESDATIEYITRSGRTRSTASDLDIRSPYNTYQNKGLPPTPITNPGTASLKAVTNPADTKYLYFLTTPPPEQRTLFSETSSEHLRKVRTYLD